MTSPQFAEYIKSWASYELKMLELKQQISTLNEEKAKLENTIVSYIRNNNMQKTSINLPNNRICYYEDIQYNTITYNFLKECLTVYFNDANKAEQVCNFIRTKRIKTRKPGLKILPKKK
jgi:hypothetical protein